MSSSLQQKKALFHIDVDKVNVETETNLEELKLLCCLILTYLSVCNTQAMPDHDFLHGV